MKTKEEIEEDKSSCGVCGKVSKGRLYSMPLWNYGVREIKPIFCCNSCIRAQKRGEL